MYLIQSPGEPLALRQTWPEARRLALDIANKKRKKVFIFESCATAEYCKPCGRALVRKGNPKNAS